MANQINVDAIIRAVDQFTGPMRRIAAGIKPVSAGVAGVGRAAAGVGQQLGNLLGPLALITSGGVVAGLTKLVNNFTTMGGRVDDAAKQLGMMPEKLQAWTYAAQMNGVGQEQLATAITKMNKTVGEAAAGVDKSAQEMFRRLNINLKDAKGNIRTATDLMPELADAIKGIESPAMRTRVAMKVFSETGVKLLPMLQDGAAGLAKFEREAERLGLVMSGDMISTADLLGDTLDTLRLVMDGIGNTIAARIAPIIQPMAERFYEWAAANREIIAQRVEVVVQRIAEALEQIDWGRFWDGVQRAVAGVSSFVDWIGGWENALIGLLVLMNGGLITSVFGLAGALMNLGVAVFPLVVKGALFLSTTALPALGAAMGFIIKAIFGMNAAMALNPMGLFIAGVVAAAGAAYLIYENWEPIAGFFTDLWEGIKQTFAEGVEWIRGTVQGLAELITGPIQAIGGFISGLFAPLREARDATPSRWANVQSPQPGQPGGSITAQQRSPIIAGMQQANAVQRSQADVTVHLPNLPAGSRVETDQSGGGIDLGVETGYQMAGAFR